MDSLAKKVIKCDNCKDSLDLRKPKKEEPPNEGIQATLNAGPVGETKEYHFCDEECLRQFLNGRKTRSKSRASMSSLVTGRQSIVFEWN